MLNCATEAKKAGLNMGLAAVLLAKVTRSRPPLPPLLPGVTVGVSEVDDLSEPPSGEESAGPCAGMALQILYRDAQDRPSRRRITVSRITGGVGERKIRAWCHERRSPRTFRSDRIEEAIDLATGEVIEDVWAWLELETMPADVREALALTADGLVVLAFLAKCDGELHLGEINEAYDFVMEHPADLIVDPFYFDLYFRRLWPDLATCQAAIARMQARPEELASLARVAHDLVAADGKVTPEEAEFVRLLDEAAGK